MAEINAPPQQQTQGLFARFPRLGTTINVFCIPIGGGLVSLPLAFKTASVVPSVALCLVTLLITIFSIWQLVAVAIHVDARDFSVIGLRVFGKWLQNVVSVTVALILLGVVTSVNILLLDQVESIMELAHYHNEMVALAAVAGIVLLIVLPLSLLRRLDFLKFSSTFAILIILYIIGCVVYRGADTKGEVPDGKERVWEWVDFKFFDIASAAPMIFFAFGCQIPLVSIYWDMPVSERKRTLSYYMPVIWASLGSYFLLVLATGVSGVLAFPTASPFEGDVLKMMGDSVEATVARIGLALSLSLTCPFLVFPLRDSVEALYFELTNLVCGKCRRAGDLEKGLLADDRRPRRSTSLRRSMADDESQYEFEGAHNPLDADLSDALSAYTAEGAQLSFVADDPDTALLSSSTHSAQQPARERRFGTRQRIACTLILLSITFSIAAALPGIDVVYRVLGSTAVPFLFYGYPPLCFLAAKDLPTRNWFTKALSYMVLVWFLAVCVLANWQLVRGFLEEDDKPAPPGNSTLAFVPSV